MKTMNPMLRYGILLLVAVCLASCQVKRPDTVLSDAKMEAILYDYHIAKALGDELPYNESYKKVLYVESVFKKHGVTQAEFDSSMVWFSRHPEILAKIYSPVNERLKAKRDAVGRLLALSENKVEMSLPGDSVDVWAWKRSYRLSGMPLDNRLTFVLPSDSNFKGRDTLCWTVDFRFDAAMDTAVLPLMALQVVYEKDSILTALQRVFHAGTESLTLAADTLGNIKEVRGFVYYPHPEPGHVLWADRISLMRYHATDSLMMAADTLQTVGKHPDSLTEEITVKPSALEEKPAVSPRQQRPRPTVNTDVKESATNPELVKRRAVPRPKEERP